MFKTIKDTEKYTIPQLKQFGIEPVIVELDNNDNIELLSKKLRKPIFRKGNKLWIRVNRLMWLFKTI